MMLAVHLLPAAPTIKSISGTNGKNGGIFWYTGILWVRPQPLTMVYEACIEANKITIVLVVTTHRWGPSLRP